MAILRPERKERRPTGINHPTSMFGTCASGAVSEERRTSSFQIRLLHALARLAVSGHRVVVAGSRTVAIHHNMLPKSSEVVPGLPRQQQE